MLLKIKEFREEQRISQTELSKRAGVSRQTINGIETGKIKITTTDTIIKIADALGKKVSDIFLI